MKKILLIFTIVLFQGCTSGEPTFLEGSWKSNKELTISNFTDNPKLTDDLKKYLTKNLGELTIVLKGNKLTVYFDKPEDLEWGTFKIVSQNDHGFTLSVKNRMLDGQHFTYFWSGECFYLEQPQWGYNEYFCKVLNNI